MELESMYEKISQFVRWFDDHTYSVFRSAEDPQSIIIRKNAIADRGTVDESAELNPLTPEFVPCKGGAPFNLIEGGKIGFPDDCPSVTTVTAVAIKPGSVVACVPCWVESPRRIFVHLIETIEGLEELTADLALSVASEAKLPDLRKGILVMAKYEDDWCRAIVRMIHSEKSVSVYFIDYGNESQLSVVDLCAIPRGFASIPPFAVPMRLCEGSDGATDMEYLKQTPRANLLVHKFDEENNQYEAEIIHGTDCEDENDLLENEEDTDRLVPTSETRDLIPLGTSMPDFQSVPIPKSFSRIAILEENSLVYLVEGSVDLFYVQKSEDQDRIINFVEKMSDHYEKHKLELKDSGYVPVVADLVATYFPPDELWYRGIVKCITDVVTILFVDYGNCFSASVSEVYRLSPEFVSPAPFAFPCRLMKGPDREWADSADTLLSEFAEKDVKINFLSETEPFLVRLTTLDGVDVSTNLTRNKVQSNKDVTSARKIGSPVEPVPLKVAGPALSPDSVRDFLLNKPTKAFCCSCQTYDQAYFHLESNDEAFNAFTETVAEFCEDQNNLQALEYPLVGDVGMTQHHEAFYRCQVVKSKGEDDLELFIIDYPEFIVRHKREIFALPPALEKLPPFAVGPYSLLQKSSVDLAKETSQLVVINKESYSVTLGNDRYVTLIDSTGKCLNDELERFVARANSSLIAPSAKTPQPLACSTLVSPVKEKSPSKPASPPRSIAPSKHKLTAGEATKVNVVFSESCQRVYFHLMELGGKCRSLLNAVDHYYAIPSNCRPLSQPKKGDFGCSIFAEDGMPYRCRLLTDPRLETGQRPVVDILFIDFGNVERGVVVDDIFRLPEEGDANSALFDPLVNPGYAVGPYSLLANLTSVGNGEVEEIFDEDIIYTAILKDEASCFVQLLDSEGKDALAVLTKKQQANAGGVEQKSNEPEGSMQTDNQKAAEPFVASNSFSERKSSEKPSVDQKAPVAPDKYVTILSDSPQSKQASTDNPKVPALSLASKILQLAKPLVGFAPKLSVEDPTIVELLFVESPSRFYVCSQADENQLAIMDSILVEATGFDELKEVDVCDMCAAKFSEDGKWYRGEVQGIRTKGDRRIVEIRFIDFGNVEEMPLKPECVRKLPPVLADIRPLAFHCMLDGIRANGDWQDSAADSMLSICEEQDNLVLRCNSVKKTADGLIHRVRLGTQEVANLVADRLVQAGFALHS